MYVGLVAAMDEALEAGQYRTYGYICTGAIAYDPEENGGEGALGQSQCITAIQNVGNQVCPPKSSALTGSVGSQEKCAHMCVCTGVENSSWNCKTATPATL